MPKTHDYTNRHWGHDFTVLDIIEGGQKIYITGWGRGISVGDLLLLPNKGGVTRYKVDADLHYHTDPSDMWGTTATHAPETEEEVQAGDAHAY